MSDLKTTVIFKTDLRDSTPLFRSFSEEQLGELLAAQKSLVSRLVQEYGGQIVKGEGDAFWATFPSVTAAARAGMQIQQELRASQPGVPDDQRIALRIVIAMGDVLHQSGDIFGHPVNLAARMEKITPADEIYLSQAAWLAINPAEVETELVGEYTFKGVAKPESIYRVVPVQRLRIIKNQFIVCIDLGRFSLFSRSASLQAIEMVLTQLERLVKEACRAHAGLLRSGMGDAFVLTFSNAAQAMQASSDLCQQWDAFAEVHGYPMHILIGAHFGEMFALGIYLVGEDYNYSMWLNGVAKELHPDHHSSNIVVSAAMVEHLQESEWQPRLKLVSLETRLGADNIKDKPVYQLL